MEEEQAAPGGEDSLGSRAALTFRRLAEGRERLEQMQTKSIGDFNRDLRDLQSQVDLINWMEEQQVAWARERERLQSEVCKLRSEVEQLRAVSTSPLVCDNDPGSEEIDLKAVTRHECISASRKALAPVTPETVRARTPSVKLGIGKENICSDRESADEIQRLRLEVESWKQRMNRLSKDYKGLKSQYNTVVRLGSKGDVGHLILNPGHVQSALETSSEKPPKILRRSPGETPAQVGDASSPNPISSDLNGPSTPGILPRAVTEVVTGSATSTRGSRDPQAKVKAEPESFEAMTHIPLSKSKTDEGLDALFEGKSDQAVHLFEIPTAKNKSAFGLDAELEGKPHQAVDNSGSPTAMAGNKKRPLDRSGKPPFKFVESVRKKTERENLHGAACKLCKKFYDAVLAGNAQGAAEFRCNHLEQSRHRFRDLPPATPEGFWNIGFDSEF